jgi:hypothetical protein
MSLFWRLQSFSPLPFLHGIHIRSFSIFPATTATGEKLLTSPYRAKEETHSGISIFTVAAVSVETLHFEPLSKSDENGNKGRGLL